MSASQNSSTSSAGIPSEYRISKKWDDVIENGVVNVSTGLLVAGLASIVLFRGRNSRVAFSAFGAGCGVGATYKTAAFEFEKEKSAK